MGHKELSGKFVPLQRVVRDYMLEVDYPDAAFFRLWNLAVRGMVSVGMELFIEPVSRKLNVNPNKTVDLPSDYAQWSRVGVLNGNGQIATLTLNTGLTTMADESGERLSNIIDETVGGWNDSGWPAYGPLPWTPWVSDTYFGVPSGTEYLGSFKVDEEMGCVLLDPNYQHSYIILEYMPNPEATKDFLIPEIASECIIAFLAWRDIINKPSSRRVNNGEKVLRKQEFRAQKVQLRRKLYPFRVPVANDVTRLGFSLAVKS